MDVKSTLSSLQTKTKFQEYYSHRQIKLKPTFSYYKSYIAFIPINFYKISITQSDANSRFYLKMNNQNSLSDNFFRPFETLEKLQTYFKKHFPNVYLKNLTPRQLNTTMSQQLRSDAYLNYKDKLYKKYLKTLPQEVRTNIELQGWRSEDDSNQ